MPAQAIDLCDGTCSLIALSRAKTGRTIAKLKTCGTFDRRIFLFSTPDRWRRIQQKPVSSPRTCGRPCLRIALQKGNTHEISLCIAKPAAGIAALSLSAQAAYPEKQVTLLVGYAPGGATDIIARTLAANLTSKWGQQVVVENKPERAECWQPSKLCARHRMATPAPRLHAGSVTE